MLVARRTAPEQFAGLWEFPGGKVDAGEECDAALHRELREELGVGVRLGLELPAAAATGWRLNDRASMRVWLAEIIQGEPQPLEDHDELRWVELADHDAVLDRWTARHGVVRVDLQGHCRTLAVATICGDHDGALCVVDAAGERIS